MIETQLGPYDITEEIGKGGMATLYLAYQSKMDRFVAIKVIRPSVIEDDTVRERFQREARLIARLEHPHVLPVYDFDGSHDPPYIVMRYLEGGTLKEVLASRQLPFDEITYLLQQIGSALDYAHRQGVVHRDIKPSNIMIDREGNAFVMDFGIARMTGRSTAGGGITGTGIAVGTPDYMCPEQIMGTTGVDLRADIYSLGVMLFQMLTGQLPFAGESPMGTMLMHLRDPAPSAVALNPELPSEMDEVFQRALAKEPEGRYDSINEFVLAVLRVLGGVVASTPTQLRQAAQESVSLRRDRLGREMPTPASSELETTPSEQYKTITAVYADAAEYAEIVDLSSGPAAARQAVNHLWQVAGGLVGDYGGAVFNQSERDLLALWGSDSAREDDPERSVRLALAIRNTLQEQVAGLLTEDEPLPIRIGVNTGLALLTVSEDTSTYTASGATISLASRVADNADGLVLITHDTYRQVQGIFDMAPDAPVRVRYIGGGNLIDTYRVLAAKPRAFRLRPRGVEGVDTRMIGRRAELEQLEKAFFNAVEDSETQMVTIVGDPGLGKSRLLHEFASWAELRPEAFFIFRGRATSAMTHRPYALWRDVLSFRFEILDSDSPAVVQQKMESGINELIGQDDAMAHLTGYLAGFEFEDSPHLGGEPHALAERAQQAVVHFFSRLSEEDPIVMQLDDLHHADDASLDLLAELVSADENLPLLVVGTARPELYERRSAWGSGLDFHLRIDLRPLDKRDSRDLVVEILQKVDELPKDLRDLIVKRAEGNPYYMEELVKMLIEDRVVQKLDEERWTVESSRLERLRVPPTLVGLLQARFDSLLYPEKRTLQRAAVVGRIFYDSALEALDAADEVHVDDLSGTLEGLVAREFIYPREASAFDGSQEYIFGQAMLRDLILETLLERQLKVYSRATAEWLAAQSGERAGEYDALIAEHYEKAGDPARAAEYLSRAGAAAFSRGALAEGVNVMRHGLELLDDDELASQRLAMRLQLAFLCSWMGAYDDAYDQLWPALEAARELGDRQAEANALTQLGRIAGAWQGDYDAGKHYLEQALPIVRELEDQPGLVFTLRQLGNLAYATSAFAEAKVYLEESHALALEIDDMGSAANALSSLGESARFQVDYEAALAYYNEALAIGDEHGEPNISALVTSNLALVQLDKGDYSEARQIGEKALAMARELGTEYLIAGCLSALGGANTGLGEDETARRYLDEALQLYLAMGNWPDILYCLPDYARMEARTGDRTDALKLLALILAHPSLSPDARLRAEKALGELRGDLSDEELQGILESSAEMDIEVVVKGFLGEDAP